jgi:MFS family permease
MNYLFFLKENRRFLGFGFLLMFCSSFGQTFFIGLFGEEIRAALNLSSVGLGAIYSLATLASAATLFWIGRRIDEIDLRLYIGLVGLGLAAAALFMSTIASVALLFAAFYALRFTGQGLMSHASVTSMARYFGRQRGKALSVSSIGFSCGEAVLPLIAVALIAAVGWQQSWAIFGGIMALFFTPLLLWLLRGHAQRHRAFLENTRKLMAETGPADNRSGQGRAWTRGEVLRDPRFYLFAGIIMSTPFILTGLFFHQAFLAHAKGWELSWLATCFTAYAAAKIATTLVIGPMVDRFGALRLLPYSGLPLIAGLAALGLSGHPAIAMAYMLGAGITTGAFSPISGALWPELYGVTHLGAIKALISAVMVFSTALSPVTMGWLMDAGVAMNTIVLYTLVYAVAASLLAFLYVRRHAA